MVNVFFFLTTDKKKMRYNCTFDGLHDWSTRMFEKFGWMILAHRDGHKKSIEGYLAGLKYLSHKIKNKHAETEDPDRKKDLEELLINVLYLSELGKKIFI